MDNSVGGGGDDDHDCGGNDHVKGPTMKRCKLGEDTGDVAVVEPSADGGDGDDDGSGPLNPMLVELVLTKVFGFYKSSFQELKNFRTVCKTWDGEVCKIFRTKAEMDIGHLLYPDSDSGSDLNQEPVFDYDYNAPFENVMLRGCCKTLEDPNMAKWFQIHGSTIKRLRFRSTLDCYHHTRFLECILKLWCGDLVSINLDGVHSLTNFSRFSGFNDSPFLCNLKELIVCGDGCELRDTEDCRADLESTYLNFTGINEAGLERRFRAGSTYNWIAYDSMFSVLLLQLAQIRPEDPDIAARLDVFDKSFGTDGGLFGQILQKGGTGIERLVVNGLLKKNFFLNAVVRNPEAIPNLKSLEFGSMQMFLKEYQFRSLQNLHLPLTKLVLGPILTVISPTWIHSMLLSCADTLQHLEFTGDIVLWDLEQEEEREFINMDIPLLPNVTTFINGNIFCTRLTGLDFMKTLPKLERCSLTNAISHSSIFPLNPSQVFNLLFQAAAFGEAHPLKELHLDGKITFTRHVEMLSEWFPRLKKVDLTLEGADVFVEFFQIMKHSQMEDVKLSFYSNDNEWCNSGIANNVAQIPRLKFLELVHLADHPLVITAATCSNGFARASALTSLRLENFGMFIDEVGLIRESLSGIGFVKFPNCVLQYRPAQMEFSICRVEVPHGVQMQQ